MGCGGLWWAKKVHSPEITYMHLATRSWRYALHLLLELPTFSGIYALKLCLELATRSWCYALNLRRAWNFQRALHVIVVICSWNFQHALEFRLWIYSWNLQHALGVTLFTSRTWQKGSILICRCCSNVCSRYQMFQKYVQISQVINAVLTLFNPPLPQKSENLHVYWLVPASLGAGRLQPGVFLPPSFRPEVGWPETCCDDGI